MDSERLEHEEVGQTRSIFQKHAENPVKPRILIVHDDDSISKAAEVFLRQSGLVPERVKNLKSGCELAKSGRFQVIFSSPFLPDGSWKRLAEINNHSNPGFVVILLSNGCDPIEWGKALKDGAFEVLDALCEVPRVADVARRALWAAYLKGAGLRPEILHPLGVP
jgi:DNA-binding NtrC family response regulator